MGAKKDDCGEMYWGGTEGRGVVETGAQAGGGVWSVEGGGDTLPTPGSTPGFSTSTMTTIVPVT